MQLEEAAKRIKELYRSGSKKERVSAFASPFSDQVVERLSPLVENSTNLMDECMNLLCSPKGKGLSFHKAFAAIADKMPAEHKAWVELEDFWPIALTFLSVDKNARQNARPLAESAKKLSPHHKVDEELSLLLDVLDDEPMVVISPEEKSGFIGKMDGIVKNEQLHVLLMDLFLDEESKIISGLTNEALAVAKGTGPPQIAAEVYLEWNMYIWRALTKDKSLPEPDDMSDKGLWIWDIDTPRDIPKLDGHRVILLGAPSYARHWQASRPFELLRAELSVNNLSAAEVNDWLCNIPEEQFSNHFNVNVV